MNSLRNTVLQRAVRRAIVASVVLGAAAGGASAQQSGEQAIVEQVVVTGTRIRSADAISNSPVATVSDLELQMQGVVNIEEALRSLPQAVPGRTSLGSANQGSTSVDLRGLGESRTLVLVDGTRWVPTGTDGVVDLNTIPTALIQRVEVVTGGASAVYGSDALAGVVNFIMKDDFEGAEVSVSYRTTERGHGDTYDVNLLLGGNFADGRGNAVVYGTYTDREEIFQDQRGYSKVALNVNTADRSQLIEAGSTSAFPANILLSDCPNGTCTFGPGGQLIGETTNFNFAPDNYFQVPQTRYQGGGMASFEINDSVELYSRFAFSNNVVNTQLAGSATFFRTFNVNPDNPFLPQDTIDRMAATAGPEAIAAAGGNIPTSVGYRYPDPRNQRFSRNSIQVMGGLRGAFTDNWTYDTYYQYSRTDLQRYLQGDASQSRTQQALLVVDSPDGPVCMDQSGGCAPLNIWTDSRADATPEALDFIALNLNVMGSSVERIFAGNVTGTLGNAFVSPFSGEEIGVSFGAEYRDVEAENLPDDVFASGGSSGYSSDSVVVGGFDVAEFYAETRIPLVQGRRFVEHLGLEAGYRYSDYSNNAGSVHTYKIGGDWAPVPDIRFRSLYQRAVRAPNIIELFRPQVESSPVGVDPCAGPNPTASEELCLATDVPAGRYGSVPVPPNNQFFTLIGGNPDLEAEESDTWTFGAVITPEALPGFTASLDFYSVEITGAINQLAGGGPNVLQACYIETQDPDSVYCRAISRGNINGALFGAAEAGVQALSVNTGLLKTQGIDFAASYRFDLGEWGSLGTSMQGTYVDSFKIQGDPILDRNECAGLYGSICGNIRPDLRVNARASWDYQDMSLSLRARHVGKVKFDAIEFGRVALAPTPSIGATTYFDLEGSYELMSDVRVNFGMTNIFGKNPPIVAGTGGGGAGANTFPEIYDPLGRQLFGRLTMRF